MAAGEPLLDIHARSPAAAAGVRDQLRAAFTLRPEPLQPPPLILGRTERAAAATAVPPLLCAVRRERTMIETRLEVRADAPIGTISPRLYGHFAEHLGRCCYDGLWVGEPAPISRSSSGFRTRCARRAAARCRCRCCAGRAAATPTTTTGATASARRPSARARLGMSCGLQVEDDNSLGTHEFLGFCAALGAEPYLAGNVGSGTPQELCDWLEYCNSAARYHADARARGQRRAAPFGVRLWGVGNENWGCGGNYDAATYAREYRRYAHDAAACRPERRTGRLRLRRRLERRAARRRSGTHLDLVDHLSIHRYWIHGGPETEFSDARVLRAAGRGRRDRGLRRAHGRDHRATPRAASSRIGIALDEWGVWHPEARAWGPGDEPRRAPITYEQAGHAARRAGGGDRAGRLPSPVHTC